MAMASYRNSVTLAQEAVLREDLFRMRDAIDQYYADKNKYPSTLESLVSDGYLRALPAGSVHEVRVHVAGDSRRARREQPHRGARRLQRPQRLRADVDAGHALQRVVNAGAFTTHVNA